MAAKDSVWQLFSRPWLQLDLWPLPECAESSRPTRSKEKRRSKRLSKESRRSVHKPSGERAKLIALSQKGIPVGEDSPHAKYTDSEIDTVFRLLEEGYSNKDIALMMDMPKSTVWAITHGLMRATVVDRWEKRKRRN